MQETLRKIILVVCVLLIAVVASNQRMLLTPVVAKEKAYDWKSGQLTDIDQADASRLIEGTTHERANWIYVVDDGTYIWRLQRDTRRHDKPLEVTINTKVTFAVDRQDAYMKDESDKVHKLSVQTKALKQIP